MTQSHTKIPITLKKKIPITMKDTSKVLLPPLKASKGRLVADPSLFQSVDPAKWELAYQQVMDKKYAKGTRNYSQKLTGAAWKGHGSPQGSPPIYVVPRQRGGPSYKSLPLEGVESEDVQYALISKGFGMQDLSSFTLGPIVGEGLCLVNAAFSKLICVEHIEGGGKFDLNAKNFWRRSNQPDRVIQVINEDQMIIDSQLVSIKSWLTEHEQLWLSDWEQWRQAVALCGLGDFHWSDNSETVGYRYNGQLIDFITWKRECYIRLSYQLLPTIKAYQFLEYVRSHQRPLGLVHPKGMDEEIIPALTIPLIEELFQSKTIMCCQPYVIAGKLLGVTI